MLSMKRIGFINLTVESVEICVFHYRGVLRVEVPVISVPARSDGSNTECCFIHNNSLAGVLLMILVATEHVNGY